MNYNFENESQLCIPKNAYRPYKRCEFCQSVYLTDNLCESCGRSVRYDLIGDPFGHKSFYGIKERYIQALPAPVRLYPFLENIKSPEAKALIRQLQKRLGDLAHILEHEQKKLFDIEALEIMNELLFYSVSVDTIRSYLGHNFEYEKILVRTALTIRPKGKRLQSLLNYRLAGALRVKFALVTATFVVGLIYLVTTNLQFGK